MTVGSNFIWVEPVANVLRFSRSERKHVQMEQPKLITDYNKFMGGVDLADNMVSNYRIRVRGKKWWWPIFSNYVDVSMVNAWRLWQCAHPHESCVTPTRKPATFGFQTPSCSKFLEHKKDELFKSSSNKKAKQIFHSSQHTDCLNKHTLFDKTAEQSTSQM